MKTPSSAAITSVSLLTCVILLGACSDDEQPPVDQSVDLTNVDVQVPSPDQAGDTKVAGDAVPDSAEADAPTGDQTLDLPPGDLSTVDQAVADAGGDVGPGCGKFTSVGCCDGETLKLCAAGKLVVTDCTAAGKPKCGWNLKWGWYACGTNGSGDPSGKAPKSCSAPAPDASTCGAVTTQGCCLGKTLKYCENGKLKVSDCTSSPKCGWDASSSFYDCGTKGAADPSGKHPLSCTGAAVDAGPVDATPDTAKPDLGDTCKGISKDGCCAGEVLKFCDSGGKVVTTDCTATKNPMCGWDPAYGWYNCGTKGAADPSGKLAKACPGTAPDAGPDKAVPDKAVPDKALPDKALPDAAMPDAAVSTANVVITEVMIDPKAADDSKGEWFEIHNAGSTTVNIHGWTVSDKAGAGQQKYTFLSKTGNVPFPAGGYYLIGINQSKTTNGNVPVALRMLTKWTLDNTDDEIYLHDAKKLLVDKVEYDTTKGWVIPNGATLSLKNHSLDNNDPKSWCAETKAWCTSCDKGTPLKKSGCP